MTQSFVNTLIKDVEAFLNQRENCNRPDLEAFLANWLRSYRAADTFALASSLSLTTSDPKSQATLQAIAILETPLADVKAAIIGAVCARFADELK